MKRSTNGRIVSIVAAAALGIFTTGAEADIGFSESELTVDDLKSVYSLNIYKFALDSMTEGTYRLTLRERDSAEAPWRNLFSEEFQGTDAPGTYLMVSFTRRGGEFGSVLLGQAEETVFKFQLCDADRCYVGMTTIVPVPLHEHNGLVLFTNDENSPSANLDGEGVRFLTLKPSSQRARETGNAEYPRAELVLEEVAIEE